MRLSVMLLTVGMLIGTSPAWAYLETQPGTEEWPEILDRAGMKAFQDIWMPQCNNGALQDVGNMTIHADGRITYQRDEIWPTRYRVIEETPHYVLALVRASSFKSQEIKVAFWALRPLGKSFRPRGDTDMSTMGVNYCIIDVDVARATEIWNLPDAELAEFWTSNKHCHPSKTKKVEGGSYWGEGWSQNCYYARSWR